MANEIFMYLENNWEIFMGELRGHLILCAVSLSIAMFMGISLGIVAYYNKILKRGTYFLANTLRVVPSIALLTLMLPIIGTGKIPAMIALTILAFPPIFIHTHMGMSSISQIYLISAQSLGLSKREILLKIQWPLMRTVLLTGVVISGIEVVASATLASFIGGGGLGTFIVSGLSMYSFSILLVGAIPVAILALAIEMSSRYIIKKWERVL